MILEQHRQWQMPSDQIRDLRFQPRSILIIDDIRNENDQCSFPTMLMQVHERVIKPAFNKLRMQVMHGMNHPIELLTATLWWQPTQDPVRKAE